MKSFAPATIARTLIAVAVLGASSANAVPAPQSNTSPFVTSDTATLRVTLVLPLGDWIYKSSQMGGGMPFFSTGHPPGVIDEYQALIDILEREGVEVLNVHDLVQDAIDEARERGTLADVMRDLFPGSAEAILQRLDEIDADSIFFLRDDHVYMGGEDGAVAPLFPGFGSMYWARDWAATTPKGVVIGNSRRFTRSLENKLAKFIFEYADRLEEFPVVFDAGEEGVHLDGGDLIVLDENTILLGVGNRTSREAAPKLAKKLDMEVIAVALPAWEERTGLARALLHLDTTFSLVDDQKILAVPYFHESRYAESNPVARMLLGVAKQAALWNDVSEDDELTDSNVERIQETVNHMPLVGKIVRYAAGSGEEQPLDDELVDLFVARGYEVILVGGPRGDLNETKWAMERAMYELRYQGANVVQLAPGRVIAFEHNVHTNQALRDAGVQVLTFPGELIAVRGGGPHCLLMPLVRYD